MSLALKNSQTASAPRGSEPSPVFPRLAREQQPGGEVERRRVEAPPSDRLVDEEDPERWDGMA